MQRIEISPYIVFDDEKEIQNVCNKIDKIGIQIHNSARKVEKLDQNTLSTLCLNIKDVIKFWTGCFQLGCRKNKKFEESYQRFFQYLYQYLLHYEPQFLYQGKVYRYLGYKSEPEQKKYIDPECNNVYVSWSKEKQDSGYFNEKLKEPITRLEYEITGDEYGIDLEEMDLSKGNEKEVVFPTKTDCKIFYEPLTEIPEEAE